MKFRFFGNHLREFLLTSIVLNLITAMIKFCLGIMIPSYLFGFNAGYYICLCIARILIFQKLDILKDDPNLSVKEKRRIEIQVYKKTGYFTILMGILYFVSSLQLQFSDEGVVYSGFLVYYVALMAFSKFVMAVYGKRVQRKFHKPILAALKQISFSDALVSIVVTECTLLVMKGNENANVWSSYLGLLVSGVILIQGIMMLVRVRK